MTKLHVRKGDKVLVIAGKDKGKEGVVLKALPQKERVVVEGCGVVKKALRPTQQNPQGGIIHKEAAIDASNVMLYCPKCGKGARFGHKVTITEKDGKKIRNVARVCKRCGNALE